MTKKDMVRKLALIRRFFRRIDRRVDRMMDWLMDVLFYMGGTGAVTIYYDGPVSQQRSIVPYDGHVLVRQFGEHAKFAWVGFTIENRRYLERGVRPALIVAVVSAVIESGFNPTRVLIDGKPYSCYPVDLVPQTC